MTKMAKGKMKLTIAKLALLLSLALIPASGGSRNQPQDPSQNQPTNKTEIKGKVVYVCACLKTESCSCMTEAKTEGPCSCGTEGGPPMKAVPKDSAWAKANRKELAK